MASKYDAINQIKKNNPQLTWTQAAHEAGFEGQWTSHKGKAKPRTGDKVGQASKRRKFDTNSTDLAAKEAKQLESTKLRINQEATLYGVEPTQIEHLSDQDDAQAMTSGAPGDPDNKLIVKESDARFKDKVKQSVGKDYAAVNNPVRESIKVISKKYFDPIADPDTLPGVDVRNDADLNDVIASFKQNAAFHKGLNAMASVVANTGKRVLKNSVPGAGTAFAASNAKTRLDEFKAQPNIQNSVQLAASVVETGANAFGDFALTTGIGAPLAAPAEAVASGAGLVDESIDVSEQLMSR